MTIPLNSVSGSSGRVFALTIDDGPGRDTPAMLAVLRKHHVRATFCLIGAAVRQYPLYVRAEVAGGHRICDHTDDHDEQLETRPAAQVNADIRADYAAIERARPGTRITYYRSPGGNFGPKQDAAAAALHLRPLSWDDDPTDWTDPPATVIYQRMLAQLHPGAIVLCHDGGGPRSNSVHAVDLLLTWAARHHYRVVFPT